jgi:predicted class III extradiol MEMO1 family dioxygenase
MNHWHEVHKMEDQDNWQVEILAGSDRIGFYENLSTKQESMARAESFIDGVKFARAE